VYKGKKPGKEPKKGTRLGRVEKQTTDYLGLGKYREKGDRPGGGTRDRAKGKLKMGARNAYNTIARKREFLHGHFRGPGGE